MATNAYYLNQFISTTLSTVGGIDDSQTTGIKIASTSGVTTDKPGILCLSYSDPIDITKAEWISYTSIDGTNELQGVTRGEEGFSAKAHSNGVTVAFPISRSHINNLNDALIIDGDETNLVEGVISPSGTSTNPSTELVTKSYADGGLVTSLSRQAIINGNFDVWQRGTSFTTGNTADRWQILETTSTQTVTRQSFNLGQTDVPNNPKYYLRNVVVSGESAGSRSIIRTKIEGVEKFSGETVTLSFWANVDASKNMSISFIQNFGTGGSPSTSVETTTSKLSITTSWQKFTVTANIPSISGKTLGTDNNNCLEVWFWFDAGSDYNARTDSLGNQSGTFGIAQVQLNLGSIALPFMPKSFDEELEACKRYFQKSYTYSTDPGTPTAVNSIHHQTGVDASGPRTRLNIRFEKEFRVTPTAFSFWDRAGNISKISTYSGDTITDNQAVNSITATGSKVLSVTHTGSSGILFQYSASAEL